MSNKFRYILISFGFLIFLILAPLLVLYVGGWIYDFQNHKFIKTGILALKVEPKAVDVALDGKLVRRTAGDIKFLLPKEYELKLSKDGYFAWSKKFNVHSNQVTWANPPASKILLFFSRPEIKNLASDVSDFQTNGKNVFYLAHKKLLAASGQNENLKTYVPPKPAEKLLLSPSGKTILLLGESPEAGQEIAVFDLDLEKFFDISGLFSGKADFKFSGGDQLFALENSNLYKIDFKNFRKSLLYGNTQTFAVLDDSLYFIQELGDGGQLLVSEPPYGNAENLLKNLPDFERGEIFVNFEKQLFLLLDQTLYKTGQQLEKLASGVSQSNIESRDSAAIFSQAGELNFYSPAGQKVNFITRADAEFKQPKILLNLNYAFAFKDNQILAIELDTRDRQNQYILYSGKDLKKFVLDEEAKTMFVLDGGELKSLKIR